LVILGRNPLKVDPMKINDMKVFEIIKEGKTIYGKGNQGALGRARGASSPGSHNAAISSHRRNRRRADIDSARDVCFRSRHFTPQGALHEVLDHYMRRVPLDRDSGERRRP
jgi:hypothetical protein